jgi:hypothetical protein
MSKLLISTVREFQGGYIYDHRGQLIRAGKLEDGNYLFLDLSRNIEGIVETSLYPHEMEERVKDCYHVDNYDHRVSDYKEEIKLLEKWPFVSFI